MRKETIYLFDGLWSWFFIGYFIFMFLSGLRVYIVYGVSSIDFQFILVIDLIFGTLMLYLLLRTIKRNEFHLRLKPLD